MFTDHFFQKLVQASPPPQLDPLYTHGWTDIQTDGDYIKRVVHGPSGDHTLKNVGFKALTSDGRSFLVARRLPSSAEISAN